jgi:hypothetical protein
LFRARREPRPRPRISRVVKEMAGIMAATMVPAHGFIISKRGMYSTNGAMSAVGGPFGSWMRTFLGACAWAFMIAAGSLVYAHFVKKWQSSGFPMLPITALVPGAGTSPLQQQSNQTERSNSAGGLPSGSPQFQRARPPGQTSFLEEYEG